MAVSGVLNNILKAHAGSFDIKENINIENRTFSAYARFAEQNEKYVLTRKANIWTILGFEHILFNEVDRVTMSDISEGEAFMREYMEPVFVRGGNKYPPQNHMYTYLTFVLISNKKVDSEIKSRIEKYKFEKNYLFTVRGHSIGQLICVDEESKSIITSKSAKEMKNIYEAIISK